MRYSDVYKPDPAQNRSSRSRTGKLFAKLLCFGLVVAIFGVMRTEPEMRMAMIYGSANKVLALAGQQPMFDIPVAGNHAAKVAKYTAEHQPITRPTAGSANKVRVNRFSHATGNAAGIEDMLAGGASGQAPSAKGRGDWIGDSKSQAADIGKMMENFNVGE